MSPTHPDAPVHTARRPGGFSLVELVTSIAVVSIVLLAAGAAVVVSARSLPDGADPVAETADAGRVVEQMIAELTYAAKFATTDPAVVEFAVEREGRLRKIRYAWSGTPGDPLTRQHDGGEVVEVLDGVQTFGLDYDVETIPSDETPPDVEGPEQLFLQQDSSNSGTGEGVGISSNARLSQSFLPNLPLDATSWRITRVKYLVSPAQQTNGMLSVSVRRSSGNGRPSGMIDEVLEPEANFSNNAWYETVFPNAGGLDPATAHHVAFERGAGGGTVARIKVGAGSTNSPDTRYWWDDGGGTWSEDPTRDVWLWVWGRVSETDPDWTPPVTGKLRSLRVTLNATEDASTLIEAGAVTVNRPEVAP